MAHFTILLGKSENGVPHPDLENWRAVMDRNIHIHEDDQGNLHYLVGQFESPRKARAYFETLKSQGLAPIKYFPLVDDCMIPIGWEGRLVIGVKAREVEPRHNEA